MPLGLVLKPDFSIAPLFKALELLFKNLNI